MHRYKPALVLLLFLITACAGSGAAATAVQGPLNQLSPSQPPPTIVPTASPGWISTQDFKLWLDTRLAKSWRAGIASGTVTMSTSALEYRFISFEDYYSLPFLPRSPAEIVIIPIEDYESANREDIPHMDRLSGVLAQKPAILSPDLEYLPLINAGMLIHARPVYLTFASGSGVSYLTMFSQEPFAINNTGLLYVFQGITTDGRYLVSARFPMANSALSNDEIIPPANLDYAVYLEQVTTQLTQADPSTFYPDPALLDAMIQTLTIEK